MKYETDELMKIFSDWEELENETISLSKQVISEVKQLIKQIGDPAYSFDMKYPE
jgi:hypothetical protein